MGENPKQIENHIRRTRNELSDNLSELQEKVKNAIDWRAQFSERPMTMIGIAFGGGVLMSSLLGGRSKPAAWAIDPGVSSNPNAPIEPHSNLTTGQKGNHSHVWENIKDALLGIAASRLTQYLDVLVPGFQEQYKKRSSAHETSGKGGDDQPIST